MSAAIEARGGALAAEELARANLYGLVARLFYAPPDADLLAAIATAPELAAEDDRYGVAAAWRDLKAEAARADAEAVREEYDAIFIGTGKAEVTPYAGAHLMRHSADTPLVRLRNFLSESRLVRRESANEPEDHIAGLCEAMRHLILRGDAERQERLFREFLYPGATRLCDAIDNCAFAVFYRAPARLLKNFLALEQNAFDMV